MIPIKKIKIDGRLITYKGFPYKVVQRREKENKRIYVWWSEESDEYDFVLNFDDYATQSQFYRKLYKKENLYIYFTKSFNDRIAEIRTDKIDIF